MTTIESSIYLQVVADFHRDLRKRDGHSFVLHLAEPGVHLLPGQELLQAFQGLQVVGHDEDHGGLLLAQRHVQHKQAVLCVLVEVIQTFRGSSHNNQMAYLARILVQAVMKV